MDKVSIIIPVYNCPYVDQAIESALAQTHPNVEIIVVNDGSTKHMDKMEKYKKNVTLIHKQNGGTASALNAGIRHSSGDYISWLSADDIYYPEKTAKQLKFMKEKQIAVCYSGFVHIDETGKITSNVLGLHVPNRLAFLRAMKSYCPVNGCTVMLKKEVFKNCGLFNTAFPYAHDYDMWLRVVQRYEFHLFPEPLVKYRVHPEMGTVKHEKEVLLEVNQLKNKYRHVLNQLISKERNANSKFKN